MEVLTPWNYMQTIGSWAFFWTEGPELSSDSERIEKNKNHSKREWKQDFLIQCCLGPFIKVTLGKYAQMIPSTSVRGSFGLSSGITLNYGRISGSFVSDYILFLSLEWPSLITRLSHQLWMQSCWLLAVSRNSIHPNKEKICYPQEYSNEQDSITAGIPATSFRTQSGKRGDKGIVLEVTTLKCLIGQ